MPGTLPRGAHSCNDRSVQSQHTSLDPTELRAPWVRERPPLVRPKPAPVFGVCAALSNHLGGPADAWRTGFILLTLLGVGSGIPLYALLALLIPRAEQSPDATSRLAAPLAAAPVRTLRRRQLLFAALLAVIALTLLGWGTTSVVLSPRAFALVLVAAGAAAIWSAHPEEGKPAPAALIIGGAAVVLGVILLVSFNQPLRVILLGMVATCAAVGTLALVLYPHLVAYRNRLRQARDAHVRETERTAIAAHLHDSVLQTLALIRSRADDAEEVRALARAQERDLRRYLYADRQAEATSAATQLARIAGSLEDRYRQEISVVITGDAMPTSEIQTLLAASSEALTNACKHGGGKAISLYGELSDHSADIWVRDRGAGFDPDNIPADRHGIRDSIYARMHAIGGQVEIRSPLASGGSEVHLSWQVGGKNTGE